jgi:hypothetical protein
VPLSIRLRAIFCSQLSETGTPSFALKDLPCLRSRLPGLLNRPPQTLW